MIKREDEKKSRFDRWVIPSLLKTAKARQSETSRIWKIELPLTSGEVYAFYTKAKTKQDALKIAEGYEYLIHEPRLREKGFVFRPSTQ
tara:strand:+ start:123 stop:386 length:264 start_codon:yes stop_codon:yes gene_type:complete